MMIRRRSSSARIKLISWWTWPVKLGVTGWCFAPILETPAVNSLPAHSNGFITFGSFNNQAKLTAPLLEMWARLLVEVPDSRLLLKNFSTGSAVVRRTLLDFFAQPRIAAKR